MIETYFHICSVVGQYAIASIGALALVLAFFWMLVRTIDFSIKSLGLLEEFIAFALSKRGK